VIAEKQDVPALLSIAQDRRHGETRDMIVRALGRRFGRDRDVIDVLRRLVDDPDIGQDAQRALSSARSLAKRSSPGSQQTP
jgi:hypothetical protein